MLVDAGIMGRSWTQDMFKREENDMLKQGGVIVLGLLWGAIAVRKLHWEKIRSPWAGEWRRIRRTQKGAEGSRP